MDPVLYVSFDLTGCTDGSGWTVELPKPGVGRWTGKPPATLSAGQSYGESLAAGTSDAATDQYCIAAAPTTNEIGTGVWLSIVLNGPYSDELRHNVQIVYSVAMLPGQDYGGQVDNGAYIGTYRPNIYFCVATPSATNQYQASSPTSGTPLYVICTIAS